MLTFLIFLIGALASLVFQLWKRVGELEAAAKRTPQIHPQWFLRELRSRHAGRFPPSPEPHDEFQAAEELARIVSTPLPALRRVLTFSMWMSRDFVTNVIGMTEDELLEVRHRLAPDRLWPAVSMTIEQWENHTVVFENSKRVQANYDGALWDQCAAYPYRILHHEFGRPVPTGATADAWSFEVVVWEGAIRCWARGGRFKATGLLGPAEDEFQFITIPLDPDKLARFLRPKPEPEDLADELEAMRRLGETDPSAGELAEQIDGLEATSHDDESEPWDRSYEYSDENVGWHLHVLDNVAYAKR
jgi:hypothetical protein